MDLALEYVAKKKLAARFRANWMDSGEQPVQNDVGARIDRRAAEIERANKKIPGSRPTGTGRSSFGLGRRFKSCPRYQVRKKISRFQLVWSRGSFCLHARFPLR
ncbi:MAG: hypothetical protein P8181_09980, partial [bacterium]